ncbi:hypothetical protein Gogos_021055, partial [Gossypium gossypioides]|nr:hypothetical protein [Gossypium gossypioides]
MPGGVNSPVRAFNLVGGQAVVIDSLKGCCVWDTDGNEYVNYVGSWGHADDDEISVGSCSLAETMKKGTSFGTPCLSENVLAETKHPWALPVPFTEWQRSSNLGDVTDPFLVKDGSGVATLGLPHSSGVPEAATSETLNNDISAVENNFKRNKGEPAAIILEPLAITGELVQGILDAGKRTGHAICGGPVHNLDNAKKSVTAKFARFFYWGMLEEGVYFAPS